MRSYRWMVLALASLTGTSLGPAPTAAQNVTLSGQIRPRFEYRDPVGGGMDDFTSMRVRLAVDADVGDGLMVFVQLQDVRVWGEESHPLFDFSADALDLHQGYLRFNGERFAWLTTTVGRMETSLGGERLVGTVDWAQQGQSFDGLRFDVETDRTSWAILGYAVADETVPGIVADEELYGVYGTVREVGPGSLDVYWLYDRVSGVTESDEHLLGARYLLAVLRRLDHGALRGNPRDRRAERHRRRCLHGRRPGGNDVHG